jgi:hypothetical protein
MIQCGGKIREIAGKAGVKMRGVTDTINFDRQGEVEDIKTGRSDALQRSEAAKLEESLRKAKGCGHTPDW